MVWKYDLKTFNAKRTSDKRYLPLGIYAEGIKYYNIFVPRTSLLEAQCRTIAHSYAVPVSP